MTQEFENQTLTERIKSAVITMQENQKITHKMDFKATIYKKNITENIQKAEIERFSALCQKWKYPMIFEYIDSKYSVFHDSKMF